MKSKLHWSFYSRTEQVFLALIANLPSSPKQPNKARSWLGLSTAGPMTAAIV